MEKLSAVIITFNEEQNIERCLKSLQDVADEILVLDSFSTDKTEELCKKYKVRFEQHPFDGHIQQKNRAMEMATHDYVLSLDADEALDDFLRKSIHEVRKKGLSGAYKFNRLTRYVDQWIRHSGWYPDTKVRLWNRKEGRWGGINPHDRVELNPKIPVEHLKGDLLHYSYYSLEEHMQQNDYFSTISAKAMFEEGKKSSLAKAIIKSAWIFVRNYFFKVGFLDGVYGYVICRFTAQATFAKYMKLRDLRIHRSSVK
jgi:glycosyltransferase involved in cell wall biosynthesis